MVRCCTEPELKGNRMNKMTYGDLIKAVCDDPRLMNQEIIVRQTNNVTRKIERLEEESLPNLSACLVSTHEW